MSLTSGLGYGIMEGLNGKWNGMVNVHSYSYLMQLALLNLSLGIARLAQSMVELYT